MSPIPRDKAFDSTFALLSEGYRFVGDRCQRYGSDLFATRLMLQPVICMRGAEAAREFYEPDRFTRRQAVPKTTLKLLQGEGSVQTLDGDAHRRRKAMFVSLLMSPERIEALADGFERQWRHRLGLWAKADAVVLFPELQAILCRAVCEWAGLTLTDDEADARTRAFAAMIDGAGAIGPRNWRGLALRRATERWASDLIDGVRSGRIDATPGGAVRSIAGYPADDGRRLPAETAATELLNVLRPTVAVANYILFAALALHQHHRDCRPRLSGLDDREIERFVLEVRRFYPFFPFIGGRVARPFAWRGHAFGQGDWVVMDLYGTNHDPALWPEPDRFNPDRFAAAAPAPDALIPQGGGGFENGHRCPGEWITIALMKRAVRLLVGAMHYEVPPQDLRVPLSRIPALPRSRLVLAGVRATGG